MRKHFLLLFTVLLMSLAPVGAHPPRCSLDQTIIKLARVQARVLDTGADGNLLAEARAALQSRSCNPL